MVIKKAVYWLMYHFFLVVNLSLLLVGCTTNNNLQVLHELALDSIEKSDIHALEQLIKQGLPVGGTREEISLLQFAIICNKSDIVQFLLKKGADPAEKIEGKRLIDIAYENGNTNLCQLLALTNRCDRLVAGVPVDVWDACFRFAFYNPEKTLLVAVNQLNPGPELQKWLRERKIKWVPHTRAEISNDGIYVVDHEPAIMHRVDLVKVLATKYRFSVSCRGDLRPLGFMTHGQFEITKEYGYWFCKELNSMSSETQPPKTKESFLCCSPKNACEFSCWKSAFFFTSSSDEDEISISCEVL